MERTTVEIVDGPVGPGDGIASPGEGGASVVFEGHVRGIEDGRTITGLRYQTYDPMAENMLLELARTAIERFGVLSVRVVHSRGYVETGRCSFRLVITSLHRRECLDAVDWYIQQMKQDAPIWKQPVFESTAE